MIAALLDWYGREKRDMPWRRTSDPYSIWLSEIMLQQTQVATVIPYYERFVRRFPTLPDLAAADLDDVLKLWAGLGYYSRARNLHAGAKLVVDRFGGKLPDSPELIRLVPGIGQYTAGAILSIAYRKPEPLVDGNVARVLARIHLIAGDYRKGDTKARFWSAAKDLVSACAAMKKNPGDVNQALMELGATICTPRSPLCGRCPLSGNCLARQQCKQDDYPEAVQKAAVPTWQLKAWAVEDGRGRILFARRQPSGLFGGLWELPTERSRAKRSTAGTPKVTHVLTHRVLEIAVAACTHEKWFARESAPGRFPCWSGKYTTFKWLKPSEVLKGDAIALSSVQRKIVKQIIKDADSFWPISTPKGRGAARNVLR